MAEIFVKINTHLSSSDKSKLILLKNNFSMQTPTVYIKDSSMILTSFYIDAIIAYTLKYLKQCVCFVSYIITTDLLYNQLTI